MISIFVIIFYRISWWSPCIAKCFSLFLRFHSLLFFINLIICVKHIFIKNRYNFIWSYRFWSLRMTVNIRLLIWRLKWTIETIRWINGNIIFTFTIWMIHFLISSGIKKSRCIFLTSRLHFKFLLEFLYVQNKTLSNLELFCFLQLFRFIHKQSIFYTWFDKKVLVALSIF